MRGQHKYIIHWLFGAFCFSLIQLFAATPLAAADTGSSSQNQTANNSPAQCETFKTNEGYFFDDYESHDYNNGFLAMHFKLKQPYNDGRSWTDYGFYIYNQPCAKEFHDATSPRVVIDPGVQKYSIRFSTGTHYDFWNDETGVRLLCQQCSGDISLLMGNGLGQGSSISFYARIDGAASWMQSSSFTIQPPVPAKTPLLIIPGILGTELSYNGSQLWPNLVLSTISDDSFMDPLELDKSGQPLASITVGNVLRSINYGVGKFDYAAGLATALTAQGYTEGTTLFFFAYDWRKDPAENMDALKAQMDKIANLNPRINKIDIVAHSYGGLLLKRYILQTSDIRIGKIIFVGVPQLGTPEAAQALIFGDNLGLPILNPQEIFKLSQNMPMIYDLLPSAEYYKHSSGFFDDLSNIKTPTMMGYDAAQSLLGDMGKNLRLLNQAQIAHTDTLDNMDFFKLPYTVSSIVGCGVFTEKTINKMYNGEPTLASRAILGPKYRIEGDSGDGTVIMQSAAHDGGTLYYVSGISHSKLLSDPKSSAAIISLLNGQVPDASNANSESNIGASCNVSGKMLSFSSNVNIIIKDRLTGLLLTPRQDYSIIQTGNDRHIFIPSDRLPSYSVQVQDAVIGGGTSENISIHNVTTNSGGNHNTYNYNNQKLNLNILGISFPSTTNSTTDPNNNSAPDVENIDPNTGDLTTVPPSNQLDGSLNEIPGTEYTPPADPSADNTVVSPTPSTSNNPVNSPVSTTIDSTAKTDPTPVTDSNPAELNSGNSLTVPDSSIENSSATESDNSNSNQTPNVQTKTIQEPNGYNIVINITNSPPVPSSNVNTEDQKILQNSDQIKPAVSTSNTTTGIFSKFFRYFSRAIAKLFF